MSEHIEQQVPAYTRRWWADGLDFSAVSKALTVRMRNTDGQEAREQFTGQEAEDLIAALNVGNFSGAKTLSRIVLEKVQAKWPEKYAGTLRDE